MSSVRRFLSILVTATTLTLIVPTMASATTIGLSGVIDGGFTFGDTGFNQGDSVDGTFDVDLATDNSFALADLNFFSFSVGSLQFSLDGGDFVNFSGSVSSDGATVAALQFLSNFVAANGGPAGATFSLAFDVNNQPFAIVATSQDPFGGAGIGEATLAANVVGVAVPEPGHMLLFVLGLALIGVTAATRGSRRG